MFFNVFNAEPLRAVDSEIIAGGAAFEMQRPPVGTPLWLQVPVDDSWENEDLTQVAFVDDAALYTEPIKRFLCAV